MYLFVFLYHKTKKDAVQRNTLLSYHTLLHVSLRIKHKQALILTIKQYSFS